MSLVQWGAFSFGLILGWFVYYLNRYRTGDVQFSDIATVLAAVGGAAVINLFPAGSDLFGAYGIGLAVGFFGYFLLLIALVSASKNFDSDWFLDGRRQDPAQGWGYGKEARPPMAPLPPGFHGSNPGAAQQFFIGAQPVQPAPLNAPLPGGPIPKREERDS